MKKNLMNVVTFLLAVLVVIFVAIHFSNNAAKTKQINGLKDDVAALTADAEEKTKQLETLNKDAEDKAKQIETLGAEAAEKGTQLETLSADAEEKAKQKQTTEATKSNGN